MHCGSSPEVEEPLDRVQENCEVARRRGEVGGPTGTRAAAD